MINIIKKGGVVPAKCPSLGLAGTVYYMRSLSIKKDKLDNNIHFRVTKQELDYLDNLSKSYHCTIPQMLRIIIEHEMEKKQHEHT